MNKRDVRDAAYDQALTEVFKTTMNPTVGLVTTTAYEYKIDANELWMLCYEFLTELNEEIDQKKEVGHV